MFSLVNNVSVRIFSGVYCLYKRSVLSLFVIFCVPRIKNDSFTYLLLKARVLIGGAFMCGF